LLIDNQTTKTYSLSVDKNDSHHRLSMMSITNTDLFEELGMQNKKLAFIFEV